MYGMEGWAEHTIKQNKYDLVFVEKLYTVMCRVTTGICSKKYFIR